MYIYPSSNCPTINHIQVESDFAGGISGGVFVPLLRGGDSPYFRSVIQMECC